MTAVLNNWYQTANDILTQFWACSDESFPFTSVTLELPSLLWWITADDDVVDRTSQPRVLRRYHVRTTHRWNQRTRIISNAHSTRVYCSTLTKFSQDSCTVVLFQYLPKIWTTANINTMIWQNTTGQHSTSPTFNFDKKTLFFIWRQSTWSLNDLDIVGVWHVDVTLT